MDQKLFEKCLNKDTAAWDEFIVIFKNVVLKSIKYELRFLKIYVPRTEIDDIMQDIFLMIWEDNRLSRLKGPECIKGYLAIISIHYTHNYCRKHHFKISKNTLSLDALLSENSNTTFLDRISSKEPQVIDKIGQNECVKRIEKEISKLNPKQQLAIRLSLFDGFTQSEISSLLKIPKGTVSALLKRSKDFLKKKLGHSFMLDLKGL